MAELGPRSTYRKSGCRELSAYSCARQCSTRRRPPRLRRRGGTAWSRETEDCRDGRGGVLETRSTDEGGELARPESTGGKGWTSGRPDYGIHGDTPRSS